MTSHLAVIYTKNGDMHTVLKLLILLTRELRLRSWFNPVAVDDHVTSENGNGKPIKDTTKSEILDHQKVTDEVIILLSSFVRTKSQVCVWEKDKWFANANKSTAKRFAASAHNWPIPLFYAQKFPPWRHGLKERQKQSINERASLFTWLQILTFAPESQ